MQRSESDILSKAPIKIMLGETEYEVKPLTLTPARVWREKLSVTMSEVSASFKAAPSPENLSPALTAALIAFPEKLAELIFAYSPSLPKETILNEATDEQLCVAYGKVMAVAFPFLAQLKATNQILSR